MEARFNSSRRELRPSRGSSSEPRTSRCSAVEVVRGATWFMWHLWMEREEAVDVTARIVRADFRIMAVVAYMYQFSFIRRV